MLLRGILSIVLNAVALIAVAQIFESFHVESFGAAIIASLILAVLNTFLKPILIIFTLPVTILSLGLFLFVINAVTLMITQSVMGASFVIDGFGVAIIAAIVISVLNLLLNQLVQETLRT